MKELYLEVTFRHGRAMAAYLYLPRQAEEKSASTKRIEPGMVVDFNASGKPIGIEITAPRQITLRAINDVLEDLGSHRWRTPISRRSRLLNLSLAI